MGRSHIFEKWTIMEHGRVKGSDFTKNMKTPLTFTSLNLSKLTSFNRKQSNLNNTMKEIYFTQRYIKPEFIGVGDNVRFKNKDYQVLINYIKGDKDRKGFIPTENFTILVNEKGKRVTCHDFKELEIIT